MPASRQAGRGRLHYIPGYRFLMWLVIIPMLFGGPDPDLPPAQGAGLINSIWVLIVLQRYFVKGIILGAVKG